MCRTGADHQTGADHRTADRDGRKWDPGHDAEELAFEAATE